MHTVELTLYVDGLLQDLLIAELADLDFDAFEQDTALLKAYAPAARWTDSKRAYIEQWLAERGVTDPIEERLLEPQNWNKLWEASIQPIAVGPFLIAPTWADVPPEYRHHIVLTIDPKMSFGTGFHESTRLVLRFLEVLVMPGDRVLDAGAGTAILAIAAVKLGAASAVAFDIDEWAQQNAVENIEQNGVAEQVDFRAGSIEVVPEEAFDLILANINRSVLLDLLPAFVARLAPGGHIVLAGVLLEDRDDLLAAARRHALAAVREASENEWWSVVLARPGEEG